MGKDKKGKYYAPSNKGSIKEFFSSPFLNHSYQNSISFSLKKKNWAMILYFFFI